MSMAPHLTADEQDRAIQAQARNATAAEVFDMLRRRRERSGIDMVNITVVRRFLKGKTHKHGYERRGGESESTVGSSP